MEKLNKLLFQKPLLTEKVLMFGEGAFLRAFACYAFEELNKNLGTDYGITVVQPIPDGKVKLLAEQDGLYTVISRGMENGLKKVETRLITCVNNYVNPYEDYGSYMKSAYNPALRYVVSNTTEAGIAYRESDKLTDCPQISFPGKVTAFLHERYKHFNGDFSKGLVFLPCELIEDNGAELKRIVLRYAGEWELGAGFNDWVNKSCVFANTLVDRITSGYPTEEAGKLWEELGYRDDLLDTCELFYFWAIEGDTAIKNELPFDKAGLNVVFADDISPYRLRKIRILNGAHTCLAATALLCGIETVKDAAEDSVFKQYIEKALNKEIIPTLDLNREELDAFAVSVVERFTNPYIKHELLGITLNSVSKFKARVLPTILEYIKRFGEAPPILCFSCAALIEFYKSEKFKISDSPENVQLMKNSDIKAISDNVLFCEKVESATDGIMKNGMNNEVKKLII